VLHISVVDHANTADLLRCLATLPAACAGVPWRLTVVENVAGTDVEAVRALAPEAEIVVNPRPRGFGANHNAVVQRLLDDPAGEVAYALVLNDDTELEPGSIATLVDFAAAHPEVAAVAPRVVDREGVAQPVMLPFPTWWSEFQACLARFPDPAGFATLKDGWLNGACLLLRVEALRRVGVFDERFFLFYEDTDLCRRLRSAGWDMAVCPDARIVHAGHGTVGNPEHGALMEQQVVRSQYLYMRKHHGAAAGEALRVAGGAARALRAAKAKREARRHPGDTTQAHAHFLRELAAYDPRRPLPHEAP
jgi:GT2 family glycosyltransferase